jgi:hypothetical protein
MFAPEAGIYMRSDGPERVLRTVADYEAADEKLPLRLGFYGWVCFYRAWFSPVEG